MQNKLPFICNKRLVKVQEQFLADVTYLLNHMEPSPGTLTLVCAAAALEARPAQPHLL